MIINLELSQPSQVRTARVRSGWDMQEGHKPTGMENWNNDDILFYAEVSVCLLWKMITSSNCIPFITKKSTFSQTGQLGPSVSDKKRSLSQAGKLGPHVSHKKWPLSQGCIWVLVANASWAPKAQRQTLRTPQNVRCTRLNCILAPHSQSRPCWP